MRYTTFGSRTGLRVSELALGTANFGTAWGGGADPATSRKIFDRFAEAGGNFIDTADVYGYGETEEILADCLRSDRQNFVVATKYAHGAGKNAPILETGPSRRTLQNALDASLSRLKVDYVDIMWAHWPDPYTPMDEILRALDDAVRAGKVLHIGLSNFPAWRIARGSALADQFGWTPIAGAQFEYSLADRSAERDLIPMSAALGMSSVTWSPLGGGLLTGKYRHSSSGRLTDWDGKVLRSEDSAQRTAVIDAVATVSEQTGASTAEVAMAWLRSGPRSDGSVNPVVGPRTMDQLEGYLRSLDVQLTDEQVRLLDEASAPDLGVPHAGVAGSVPTMLGGIPDQFIAPRRPVA